MTLEGAALDRMLTRIGYLLRLSENNPNLNEATLAAEKAQELATRYNIELAAASAEVSQEERAAAFENHPFDLGSNHTWKSQLFHTLCHLNFARGVVWTGTRKAAVIGETHNVQVIQFLYTYLVREMTRLGNEAWHKETGGRLRNRSQADEGEGTFKDRFGRGCTLTVSQRLHMSRRQIEAETPSAGALILATDAALKEALDRLIPGTRTTKTKKRTIRGSDNTSFHAGMRAGKEIALNPALSGRR